MDIDPRSLASPTTPSSTSFLPIAFLSPNFLSLTLQFRAVLYLIPEFLEALKPRSPCPHTLSDTVALVSTSFEDALTSTNHSATMLMNETLHWSSSSSSSNILYRQPSVSVNLHYSLDNAKLNPSELESQAETEGFGVCFFEVHVLKIRFSWSDSGMMPYDQGLSIAVVTGR